jgi:hypothetical protein
MATNVLGSYDVFVPGGNLTLYAILMGTLFIIVQKIVAAVL